MYLDARLTILGENLDFYLETIDFGFDNLDYDVKFKNPRGLDREKLLKMIMENSILI